MVRIEDEATQGAQRASSDARGIMRALQIPNVVDMTEPTATAPDDKEQTIPWLPPLSGEAALYGLLVLATLATRLAGLGHFALTDRELAGAVAVSSWLDGEALTGLSYSPLLWLLQTPLLALTRASELAVRLPVALAAAGLVVVLYAQRQVLGRVRALVLAALALISPSLLHYGRQADGAFLSAAATLVATLCARRARQTGSTRDGCWLAVAVAVGLTAGPGFYTWLLAAALAIAWRVGDRQARAERPCPEESAVWRKPLVWGAFAFVGVATLLLTHLGGLGATFELAGQWFAGLGAPGEPWYWLPCCLLLYEPLLLLCGVVGAVSALRQRDGLGVFALGWLGVALVIGLVGHRSAFWLADTVAPLLLLAAGGVEPLWRALRAGRGTNAVVAGVCLALLFAFGLLNALMFAFSGQAPFGWLAVGAALVVVALWLGFWLAEGRQAALSAGLALALAVLGAATLRTAVAVGYETARDPREPLVYDPVVISPQHMCALLSTSSLYAAGDERTLDIVWATGLDLEARWYLREMHDARAMTPDNWVTAQALLVAPAVDETPPAGYVGQRLAWRKTWSGQDLPLSERLRWLLLRQPVGWEEASELALWFRLER